MAITLDGTTGITASGNITGNYILGNGSQLSGIITSVSSLSNGTSNVVATSSGGNVTAGNITASGNVSATYFLGNGSFLTNLPSAQGNSITNGTSNVAITTASANVTVGVNGDANTVVISPGSIFVNGVFASPKTITSNVQMAADSTALVISPLTIGNGYSMSIPTSSTVYIWIPS